MVPTTGKKHRIEDQKGSRNIRKGLQRGRHTWRRITRERQNRKRIKGNTTVTIETKIGRQRGDDKYNNKTNRRSLKRM